MNKRYSIIIPTCKSANFTQCITSIEKYTDLTDVEIIICANGYDGQRQDFKDYKVIWNDSRIGYTKATNEGIKESSGEFVVLLNDDVVLLPQGKNDWLNILLNPFSDPSVGITGPMMAVDPSARRNFLIFFCVCIKREVFDRIGLLDEIYNPGFGEDCDFCIQAKEAGYKLLQVPNSEQQVITENGKKILVSSFPIYHAGEKTFGENDAWFSEIIDRNSKILKQRYRRDTVTAVISTRNRYFTDLPRALVAVTNQTKTVDRLLIFDDGEHKDLREENLYKYIFSILNFKKIRWEVVFGEGKGQVKNHQKSIDIADTEWIWRLDDDNIPEPGCLEKLLKVADDKTGAVAGLVIEPANLFSKSELASNKIEDIFLGLNIQWFIHQGVSEVDHLYSSFIYRRSAAKHGYCNELSVIGHREETIFTYEMKLNGWKLLVNPEAITYHMRSSDGGIRTFKDPSLWEHDDKVFTGLLDKWGIKLKQYKFVVLDGGIGDHYCFKNILPDLKKKYGDSLVIANCYPDIFRDDNIRTISIAEARSIMNIDDLNVYRWAWDRNWKGPLEDAYRGLYNV